MGEKKRDYQEKRRPVYFLVPRELTHTRGMYLNTSTWPDIAYSVCQLCRCMSCPTPALMAELDQLAYYLYYNPDLGLTYDAAPTDLAAFADASWATRYSTSGWTVNWQGASISWVS